jgi:hypothetical protein
MSWDAPQANEKNLPGCTVTMVADEFGFMRRALIPGHIFRLCDKIVFPNVAVHEQLSIRNWFKNSIGWEARQPAQKKMPAQGRHFPGSFADRYLATTLL